jgi:glycosyltransferase involved in cell wall biosynthesis
MGITIGIPFYNAEEYLLDSICSVFAQSFTDWELILIDDGSTDGSLELALSISDSRVRVISDGVNRGLPFRLNQIVDLARYDLIARMDADDLMSPSRLARQFQLLSSRPDIDLCSTGVCSIRGDCQPVGARGGRPFDPTALLSGAGGIVHASVLGRRSWFLRNRYDASISRAEDYELWLRAHGGGDLRIEIVNEALYFYREENGSTLRKMLRGYVSQISILLRCPLPNFGKKERFLSLSRFIIKFIALIAIYPALSRSSIVARRNRNLSQDEIRSIAIDFDVIRSQRINVLPKAAYEGHFRDDQ